jgi:serine/threonine-protein kinase RIO1
MIFSKFFKFFFIILFIPEISTRELFIFLRLLFVCCFAKNNEKNQKTVAELISDLGILPVKLAQWMGYFLKIQFESRKEFDLLLNSLPYLQSECKFRKTSLLELKLTEFNHIIKQYDKTPICSASIAQIYKGTTYDGQEIAIKIKHDNIIDNIQRWESILEGILKFIKIKVNMDHFFLNIKEQIDFEKEAENLKLYHRLYRKNTKVRIPSFYGGNKDILIMEYINSDNFMKVKSALSNEEVSYFTYLSRIMYQDNIFVKNVIHMDLHNGNWGIIRDKKQIVLYDFGWVLKNQTDFQRFFILTQVGRYGAMDFFLEKYQLEDKNQKLREYVNNLCEQRTLDTMDGIRLVLRMFPNEFVMDNFMFCVLSLSVFISSLSSQIEDPETYMDSQIHFMETHNVFIPLCTLIKNIRKPETKVQLEQWCSQVKIDANKLKSSSETIPLKNEKK